MHVMGVPKVEKRAEKIFEEMTIEKKNNYIFKKGDKLQLTATTDSRPDT